MNPQVKNAKRPKTSNKPPIKPYDTAHKTTRRAVPVIATLLAAGLALAACSSPSTGATPSTYADGLPKSTTPPPTTAPVHVASCATSPAIQVIDTEKFQNWNKTCIGKSALSTYRTFIATLNQVWSDPFGNGDTIKQEMQSIVNQEFNGGSPAAKLPKGCKLSMLRPGLMPRPCRSLVAASAASTSSMFASEITTLEYVASPSVANEIVSMQMAAINEGRMPQGSLAGTKDAVVRYVTSDGYGLGRAPALSGPTALPHLAPAPAPRSAHPSTEVVWSCMADHLTATGLAKAADNWVYLPQFNFGYGPAYLGIPLVLLISGSRVTQIDSAPADGARSCSPAF